MKIRFDRSAHPGVVLSDVDRTRQLSSVICGIVMSLFGSLHATTEQGGDAGTTNEVFSNRCGNREGRHVMVLLLLLLCGSSLMAFGQIPHLGSVAADQPSPQAESSRSANSNSHPDELRQELDAYAIELSRIPADPLIQPDPLAPILRPIDKVTDSSTNSLHLKFGATYTFLTQYATTTPDGVRHDQSSGRLDFTGAWRVYDHEATAASISLLIRSGTNIGISQKFNLSDRLGSGLYLNCLQGGGPQEPITVNILYCGRIFLTRGSPFMSARYTLTST